MPHVQTACVEQPCPRSATDDRGRCAVHHVSTRYGAEHKRERRQALPGARCAICGCVRDLQRDHIDPTLTGPAREAPANKRWLCDCREHRHHSRLGRRRSSVAVLA